MARLILVAAGATLLAACGDAQQGAETANVSDDALAAQNLVANDVTAIDAATGDDANMAADVAPLESLNEGNAAGEDNAADAESDG